MKITSKLLTIATALFALSCNKKNDETLIVKNERILTGNTWKKDFYQGFFYLNDALDTVIVDTIGQDLETLTFSSNHNVTYKNISLINSIDGLWHFNSTNDSLTTNLKFDYLPSSGYETNYFFPHQLILKLTENSFTIQSDTIYYNTLDASGINSRRKYFKVSYFHH